MLRAFLLMMSVGCVLLCSCSKRASTLGFKRSPSAVRLQAAPTALEGDWCKSYFMVQAMIDGRGPFRLLLDTGAAISLLDDDAAARLGSPVSRSSQVMTGGGGGSVSASGQVRIGRLVSGGATLANFDVVIHDLARFEPIVGSLDGILGYSALRGTTFTIDYPGREVTLTDVPLDPDAPRLEGEAWFNFDTFRPHIVADIAGRRIAVLVDSGSGGGFDLEAFDALPRSGDDALSHASLNLDRLVVSRAARLNGDVDLGPIMYDAPVIGSDLSGSKIGTQVMSRFRWTFDTRAGLVRMDGGPMRVEPEPVTNLGFVGSWRSGVIEVVHVAPESAAYANGLRKADRVLAINGVGVDSCACDGMREAIDRATPVVLSVGRDGEELLIEAPAFTVIP